jgi:deazaflavin-dependent oxidoreductase (nitroreductase family)
MAGIGNRVARGFLRTAVWLYRRSGGKIGGTMRGAPVLLLTTTGRRSGQPWTVPLLYHTDGDDRWVLVASNGGSPRHPAWFHNLRSQPSAAIEIGREKVRVAGAEATGEERERLWRVMADMYSGYDGYARKTDREIPVVVLQRHP